MPTVVKLVMPGRNQVLGKHNLEPGGKAQQFLTMECAKHMASYMPKLTNTLIATAEAGVRAEEGLIVVNAPQARYLYFGKVMVGRAPKKAIDKDLNYSTQHNALAGPLWDVRMWEDKGSEILEGMRKITGGRVE